LLVVVILAIAWAAVLVPPVVRARARNRPADSVSEFHRRVNVLRRTGGFAPATPPAPRTEAPVLVAPAYRPRSSRSLARRRRHDVFVTLLAAVVATGVLGFVPILRVLWIFHAVADVLFVTYIALLIRLRNVEAERDMKVRYLEGSFRGAPAAAPVELALRRSAQ